MNDRQMDEMVIFAYSSASAIARREQAKAIRCWILMGSRWLKSRLGRADAAAVSDTRACHG